jgi:nucleoside-diphosphate-sugar epimerase
MRDDGGSRPKEGASRLFILKRVGVTGLDGFTGRYVARELVGRGFEPISVKSDLRDQGALVSEIKAKHFDACIHLAGIALTNSASWRAVYDVNLIGSNNLFETLSILRPGIRCIVASSAQVYGNQPSGLIGENAPCLPQNPYAVSKYALEKSTKIWSNLLDIQIVRPFNYTGVGQDERYLVPKIIKHFVKRFESIELGNVGVWRDFGDVRSVAEAYCDLLQPAQQHYDGPVNLATGEVWSIGEIVDVLTKLTGHCLDVKVNPHFVRADEVETLGGSVEKLRHLCPTWSPNLFEETLRWMFETAAAVDSKEDRE